MENPKSPTVSCVFCGFNYPEHTPSSQHPTLVEHIKTCDKHPMRLLELDYTRIRAALVSVVGSDIIEELQAMKSALHHFGNGPDGESVKTSIGAITTLIEVRPR